MEIVMFHGKECPHCHRMLPMVDKIEQEEGIKIETFEVWHDETNAEKMRNYKEQIEPACGGSLGVPVFVKTKTKDALCGETDYKTFKKWILKK